MPAVSSSVRSEVGLVVVGTDAAARSLETSCRTRSLYEADRRAAFMASVDLWGRQWSLMAIFISLVD